MSEVVGCTKQTDPKALISCLYRNPAIEVHSLPLLLLLLLLYT
jgi:hypothetical protein